MIKKRLFLAYISQISLCVYLLLFVFITKQHYKRLTELKNRKTKPDCHWIEDVQWEDGKCKFKSIIENSKIEQNIRKKDNQEN